MNFRQLPLLILVGLFALRPCLAQIDASEDRVTNELHSNLKDDLVKDNLHGSMSAAVISEGKLVRAFALGYSRPDRDIPADTNTLYRIASITKMFTATLLMLSVEDGKVRLDDPLEKYVPEATTLQGYADRITLRQLASHTSGLQREPDMPGASIGPTDQWEQKLLACIPHTGFAHRPGEQFLYSNMGFALLGLALERAWGIPYIQLVRQRIFIPLHMDNTFFSVPQDKLDRIAQGIDNKRDGTIDTQLPYQQIPGMGFRVPNGGIWSTASDLAKFVIGLFGKSPLLKPESLHQMLAVPSGGKNYGMGVMLMPNGRDYLVGHNGSDPGYASELVIEPTDVYAVIILRNYNLGKTNLEMACRIVLYNL